MDDFDFDDNDLFPPEADDDDPIASFEAEVARRMRVLQDTRADSKVRCEAAYWLGDSGSVQAITALRKVYHAEEDRKIKKAAAYALGQFKKLDQAIKREPGEPVEDALERDENAKIRQRLENIILSGGASKKSRLSTLLSRGALLLVLTLVGLVVLNVLAMTGDNGGGAASGGGGGIAGVPTDAPEFIALQELQTLRDRAASVQQDAAQLRDSFQAAAEGGTLDCAATFNRTAPFSVADIASDDPDFTAIALRLSASLNLVRRVLENHDSACSAAGGQPEAAVTEENLTLLATILDNDLPELDRLIDDVQTRLTDRAVPSAPTDPPPDDGPTAAPGGPPTDPPPTEPPTITPVPASAVRDERRQLLSIINTATEPRGALTLLRQYWTDVQTGGNTQGCGQTQPVIPEDHSVPPEIAAAYPALEQAAESVNALGLALLRNGWAAFYTACANGSLVSQAATGIITVDTIQAAFDGARAELEGLALE